MLPISKIADLNKLAQGGQLYWSFPLSLCSLVGSLLRTPWLTKPVRKIDYKTPNLKKVGDHLKRDHIILCFTVVTFGILRTNSALHFWRFVQAFLRAVSITVWPAVSQIILWPVLRENFRLFFDCFVGISIGTLVGIPSIFADIFAGILRAHQRHFCDPFRIFLIGIFAILFGYFCGHFCDFAGILARRFVDSL